MYTVKPDSPCPCSSDVSFAECCQPLIGGQQRARTALALMRSRYSAYVAGARDYLLQTWAPETRPPVLSLDPAQRWLGLRIKRVVGGEVGDTLGEVEFIARSKVAGRASRMHEISTFRHDGVQWFYISGKVTLKQ